MFFFSLAYAHMMYMFISSTGCRKIALFFRAFTAKRPLKICIMDHNGYHKKKQLKIKSRDLLLRVSASQQTHILDINGWPNIWPRKMLPYNPRCCSKMLNSWRGQWRERGRERKKELRMLYVWNMYCTKNYQHTLHPKHIPNAANSTVCRAYGNDSFLALCFSAPPKRSSWNPWPFIQTSPSSKNME